MRLIQFYQPGQGKRVGVVTRSDVVTDITSDGNRGLLSRSIEPDDIVIDVTSDESPGVLELIELSYKEGVSMGILLADIQERVSEATGHGTSTRTNQMKTNSNLLRLMCHQTRRCRISYYLLIRQRCGAVA